MNTDIQSTYEDFTKQFGLVLTHDDIAFLLRRPVASLRRSITKESDDFVLRELASLKVKVGRRHYFSTRGVVEILFEDTAKKGTSK